MSTVIVTTPEDLRLVLQEAMSEFRPAPPSSSTGSRLEILGRLEYLTAGQVAALCGVTADTVRLWHRDGKLVAHNTGKVEKYSVEEVREFLLDRSQDRNIPLG